MKIVLASKSPRRKELLSELIKDFEIITKEVDESFSDYIHPREGVEILAVRKGKAVADELSGDTLVISSDTLVELGGIPLGKPADEAEAIDMLTSLSGKAHNVHTGVAVHYKGKVYSGVATTAVYFRKISQDEIIEYVKSGDPMDKAGAYGIQSGDGKFVEKIDGDYDTVVGLSMNLVKKLIDDVKRGLN